MVSFDESDEQPRLLTSFAVALPRRGLDRLLALAEGAPLPMAGAARLHVDEEGVVLVVPAARAPSALP